MLQIYSDRRKPIYFFCWLALCLPCSPSQHFFCGDFFVGVLLFPFSPPYFTSCALFFFPFSPPIHSNFIVFPFSLSSHSPRPFTQCYQLHPSLFFFPFTPPYFAWRALLHHTPHTPLLLAPRGHHTIIRNY